MADNHIRFKIGSEFSGEGFKKAQAAVKEVNADIKQGTKVANQIATAFNGMDAAATKNIQAMTGLVQALLSFNVTAIATQAMMLAINKYFGEMKEKAEAAQKQAEALRASVEKAFSKSMTDRISSFNKEINSVTDDFERITKQANQFAAAIEGVRKAEADGGVIQLKVEMLNKLLEAHSEEERQNIEATYNLRMAIEKSANIETEWQSKIDAAHQAIVDAENRVAKIDEQIVKVGEERKNLEQTMITAKQSGDKNWLDIQKQVTALWEKEQSLEQKKLDTEDQIQILREKEKQTKQEAVNAQNQATIEIRNAELAEKKLTEAKQDRAVKEAAAKDAAEEKAAADLLDAQKTEDATKAQQEVTESAKRVKAAEEKYAAVLKKYETTENLIADAARSLIKNQMPGGLLPVNIQKGIELKTADKAVTEAIRQGVITTVKDADRLQRQAQKDARDAITKEQKQQIAEAKKYHRLQQMNPKTLCSADRQFMEKYEKIQAAAKERKKQIDDAKKALDEEKKAAVKSKENLDNILKKLNNLGLK